MRVIVVLFVIVVGLIIFLMFSANKQEQDTQSIGDACKISANMAFAKEYMQACEKMGLHKDCQLPTREEFEIMSHRDQYVTACMVDASFSR